jgi:excisionase family DNA binding protein
VSVGHPRRVSEWQTQAEASELLDCHVSNVPKLIAKGRLRRARPRRRRSLARADVEALARARAEEQRRRAEERSAAGPDAAERPDARPDDEHDWLRPSEVAQLLGISAVAVRRRIARERLPAVRTGFFWWVRRDHLELTERARLAQRTRRP